ncbi:hypothetical protein AB0F44_23540 [Nocardioides sp. NPDC023903]|uniref:hypothetical protein n=1 Tax=Nocardioides sp. NPDC023903 TaxID=3157195 RepID=UPI0033C4D89B
MLDASATTAVPSDASRAREPIGPVRWATFAVIVVVAVVHAAYTLTAQMEPLTGDRGAQYYLGKLTAEGAVPLVDFQHGWNAGSWWVNSLVYRLAGGDPLWWEFFLGRFFGVTLSAILVAAMGLRRRVHPAAIAAMALAVLTLASPAQVKYVLPVVFAFILLPGGRLDSGRWSLVVRVLVPAALFWQHVELAILLTGAAGLYELFGRDEAAVRDGLTRCVALAAGILVGVVSEVLFYRIGYGMSLAEFNRQVVFGQAQQFPNHFGWPFFDVPSDGEGYEIVAVYPFLLLLVFVPVIWRLASDPTRFLALCALLLATVPIRRPGPGHAETVSALVFAALIFVLCDAYDRRDQISLPSRPRSMSGWQTMTAIVGFAAGAAWVDAALAFGFGAHSLIGPLLLVLAVSVMMIGTRLRARLVAVSAGACLVLGVVPLAAAVEHVDDLSRDSRQLEAAEVWGDAIRPEMTRCLKGGRTAFVLGNQLSLYDALDVENPTPFYLFHYDFGRNEKQLTAMMASGEVPVVLQTTAMARGGWVETAIEKDYEPCAEVLIAEEHKRFRIWAHRSLEPFEKRAVTVQPDGTRTSSRLP